MKISKYLPDKKQLWNFIFVLAGAFLISFFIDAKAVEVSQTWAEQREAERQKSEFVENLSVLGFSRIYHAEVFYSNKISNEKDDVIDDSFQLYMDSVKTWNKYNIMNSIFLEKYYGKEIKDEYSTVLLLKLVDLHESVLSIRKGRQVSNFKDILEEAKHRMFIFNEKLYLQ